MRILVLQLKRIGDAILTAPALGALRAALPEAEISLVLAGAASSLGRAFAMANQTLTYSPGKDARNCWRQSLLGKFDVVLDFSGTDRSAALTGISRAKFRVAYTKDAKNWLRKRAYNTLSDASVRNLHTIDLHHALVTRLLEEMNISPIPTVKDYNHLTLPLDLAPPALPNPYIVVHPGTARTEKYWPAERWIDVIRHLQETHHLPVVLTGSNDPDELAHLRAITDHCHVHANFAGQFSLLQLASTIANSCMVLGVDSAAMHLAAAFQRPQIALFGPTNPYHWQPRHSNAKLLLAGPDEMITDTPKHAKFPMTELPTDRVLRAVDSLMA
jgi:ADP-heptose:LPS heptosyltransferase